MRVCIRDTISLMGIIPMSVTGLYINTNTMSDALIHVCPKGKVDFVNLPGGGTVEKHNCSEGLQMWGKCVRLTP